MAVRTAARVARLGWDVSQPDSVLANRIVGHKAEGWPGPGEERRAMAEHERPEIESVFIDKTKAGQASRQLWSGNVDLPRGPGLEGA